MHKEIEVVISSPVRTAIGTYGGSLKDVEAAELGAMVIRSAVERAGIASEAVSSVVMGNVIQAGNRMNPARQAAIRGGLPVTVPAFTVNRVCGSGVQAVISAAQEIQTGVADIVVAGGMENMDRAPYLLPSGRWGARMGDIQAYDSMLYDGLHDALSGQHAGWHTEDLVEAVGLTREDQDMWAERSQLRFGKAQGSGHFGPEIVPVEIKARKGTAFFDQDEHNRPDTSLATLAKLRPAFRSNGTITAGNAPGLNTAAAAIVVTSRDHAERTGIDPWARVSGVGTAAVEPGMFGLGPVPAVQLALAHAGWQLEDVERIEINEAFAAVPLAVIKRLGLPTEIVNVDGGALAHGHPLGATGAVLITRLLHSMRRDGLKKGVVTLCIGGGQGIALALEML